MSFQDNVNLPKEKPVIKADFRNGEGLGGEWYFQRLSSGMYTDKDGLVNIAPPGEPRFEHDPSPNPGISTANGRKYPCKGLLIEETNTNRLRGTIHNTSNSQPWESPALVNDGRAIFPNLGTASGDIPPCAPNVSGGLSFIATSGNNGATCSDGVLQDTSSVFVGSIFVKPTRSGLGLPVTETIRLNWAGFSSIEQGNGGGCTFTLTGEGTFDPAYNEYGNCGIQAYPNDWYRVFIVGKNTVGYAPRMRLVIVDPNTNSNVEQNTSQPRENLSGVLVWGPQIEVQPPGTDTYNSVALQSVRPCQPIITLSGSTGTTQQDICGLLGDALSEKINSYEQTVICSCRDMFMNLNTFNFKRVFVLRGVPSPYDDFGASQTDSTQCFVNYNTNPNPNFIGFGVNSFSNDNTEGTINVGQLSAFYPSGINNNRFTVGVANEYVSASGYRSRMVTWTQERAGAANIGNLIPGGPTATGQAERGFNSFFLGSAGDGRHSQGVYEFLEIYNVKLTSNQMRNAVEYKGAGNKSPKLYG